MVKKKYIVTGGSGFIGSHIVDKLINENHDVVVIDNNSNQRDPIINPKATYHNLNISNPDNEKQIEDILQKSSAFFTGTRLMCRSQLKILINMKKIIQLEL